MHVSVIIPAHNEEHYLPATLAALAAQSYRDFEVIVVGNGCTDRTEPVARAMADRFYYLEERALSRARNLGGKKARGDLLLFLDADTALEPDALALIVARFSREYAAGTLKGIPDSKRLSYHLLYLLKNAAHRSHLHRGSSGVILCWRDHFRAVGGFDEGLHMRENSDLIRKLVRYGRYQCLTGTAAVTSMRRYDQRGLGHMVWHWIRIWLLALFSDIHHRQYDTFR